MVPKKSKFGTIIVVTGTPGTGKTKLSKALSKALGFKYLEGSDLARKASKSYDGIRRTFVVDESVFVSKLVAIIKRTLLKNEGLIIDSHMSHFLPSDYVTCCIVTRTNLKILKNRLERRGYSDSKVRENLDAEIFEICKIEAEEQGHKVVCVDTSQKSSIEIAKKLKKSLNNKFGF